MWNESAQNLDTLFNLSNVQQQAPLSRALERRTKIKGDGRQQLLPLSRSVVVKINSLVRSFQSVCAFIITREREDEEKK